MIRKSPTAAFERVPLIRGENDSYDGTLFDVAAPVDYFVEAVGVRSPVYSLKVADMPYVQQLELEYHFPAYTGLRAAQDRGRRRHRGPARHRESASAPCRPWRRTAAQIVDRRQDRGADDRRGRTAR